MGLMNMLGIAPPASPGPSTPSTPGFFSELTSGMRQGSARLQGLNPLLEAVGEDKFGPWNRSAGSVIGNILGSVQGGYSGSGGQFSFDGSGMGNKLTMNKFMAGMLKNMNKNPAKTTDASASLLLNPRIPRMPQGQMNLDPLGVLGIEGGSYV